MRYLFLLSFLVFFSNHTKAQEVLDPSADMMVSEETKEGLEQALEQEIVMCTADAKECADGSFVSRSGPDCSFAPCPEDSEVIEDIVLEGQENEDEVLLEKEEQETEPLEELSEQEPEEPLMELFKVHLPASVSAVMDGDTLIIDGGEVNLWGIDAPAEGLEKYEDAKIFLELITASADITCKFIEEDAFAENHVMHCLADGADIGALMVMMGMAKDNKNVSRGFYKFEQNQAQKDELGIWEKEKEAFSTKYKPGASEVRSNAPEGRERLRVIDQNPLDGRASEYTIERNKVTRPVINR